MGSHSKPSRIKKLLPTAAVPALAGMAASVCLAPQALADQAPAKAAVHSAVTATADASVLHVGMTPAQLLSAMQQSAGQKSGKAAQPTSYTIRSGDTLSSIARRVYHKEKAWTVLYWANHNKIKWANIISEGQALKVPALPAKIPAAPSQLGPPPPPPPPAPVAAAPAPAAAPVQATAATSSSYSGGSSFESCVIARESGGNSQVMNSSGHYGLYQFSASTWQAYGGSAGSFGHASVSEQRQVFANAMAQGGQSNWSPYDGC